MDVRVDTIRAGEWDEGRARVAGSVVTMKDKDDLGSPLGLAGAASLVGVIACMSAVVVLILTNHPHRAVILLAGGLFVLAGLRALLPGRPWFASRYRWLDVAFYAGLGALIWLLSPWTATMGLT